MWKESALSLALYPQRNYFSNVKGMWDPRDPKELIIGTAGKLEIKSVGQKENDTRWNGDQHKGTKNIRNSNHMGK